MIALDAVNDSTVDEYLAMDATAAQRVDDTIAGLLRTQPFTAEELFVIDARGSTERAQRDLALAKVRAALADALQNPTPANHEAAGQAVAWLCHLAMAAAARDHIDLTEDSDQ